MQPTSKQFRKRNAILSCLQGSKEHPSAEMVLQLLATEHPDISLATVYRNLALFRSQGLIQSLGTVQGIERFDACTAPHAHLVCTQCGSVADLPSVELPYRQAEDACAKTGFEIRDCQLTYTGVCGACNQKQSKIN